MGNCIETCAEETERINPQEEDQIEEVIKSEKKSSSNSNRGGVNVNVNDNMRIKIVLTKNELEWLLLKLKTTQGKRFEDVLEEIHRSREKTVNSVWKPCLDSITEVPEVPETMDR